MLNQAMKNDKTNTALEAQVKWQTMPVLLYQV
jgi:hypothetical protein